MTSSPPPTYRPFILLTPRLIIVPTPTLLLLRPYRTLYASLHADADFCSMGFGVHFPPRVWDEQEAYEQVQREVTRNWEGRGMGDMGVGLWDCDREAAGRLLRGKEAGREEVRLVEGEELERLVEGGLWEQVKWIGYAGVREARLPPSNVGGSPRPSWKERKSFLCLRRARLTLSIHSRRAQIRHLALSLGRGARS